MPSISLFQQYLPGQTEFITKIGMLIELQSKTSIFISLNPGQIVFINKDRHGQRIQQLEHHLPDFIPFQAAKACGNSWQSQTRYTL
jgi:hypothetical protein